MTLAIAVRGIEEIDAMFERAVDGADALVVVLRPVAAGHAHAAEPEPRDAVLGNAEFDVVHARLQPWSIARTERSDIRGYLPCLAQTRISLRSIRATGEFQTNPRRISELAPGFLWTFSSNP